MLRIIFWSTMTYSGIDYDIHIFKKIYIQNIHIQNKENIQRCWYCAQFSRACEPKLAAVVAHNAGEKGNVLVWQPRTEAQPVVSEYNQCWRLYTAAKYFSIPW